MSDYANHSLHIAPFGAWNQFNVIPGLVHTVHANSLGYDPIEAQIYWVSTNRTEGTQQINRCSPNGMQEETVITGLEVPESSELLLLLLLFLLLLLLLGLSIRALKPDSLDPDH